MDKKFDVVVIGGGPGGYVAAIRSAQLGASVAIIDKRKTLGGTCLNVGCIPSKALLDSSELFHQAQKNFKTHGIDIPVPKVNLKQMMKRKDDVVTATTAGIAYLMKKNNITRFEGEASLLSRTHISIQSKKDTEIIEAQSIILATGSTPTELPFLPFDGKRIISSTEALKLPEVPKKMGVIGGGVIGLELGSVYARLGTEVTVFEFMDSLIPTMDRELGKHLQRSLKKIGIGFHLETKVNSAKTQCNTVTLEAESKKKGNLNDTFDYVLVAVGRSPNTKNLRLENVGLKTDERGHIPIDHQFRTTVPTIYAIGDVVRGPMLAHKASEEGYQCAEIIAGKKPHLNYNAIPNVVYTWPEVAGVGQTEEDLNAQNIAFKKGLFPFKASGRARAAEESDGFVKILSDPQTDEVLGVHILGPRAADLIAQGVMALEYKASAEDLAIMTAAHPTYSESVKEAALMASGLGGVHL